jgi:hypothetical protein
MLISSCSFSKVSAAADDKTEVTTWTFQPSIKVPSFDITRKCLSLDYAADNYKGITSGQTEGPIHLDPNAGQAGFVTKGGFSTLPFLGNKLTVKISNTTNQISSSFSFTNDLTKSKINAYLKGSLDNDVVSFEVAYSLPSDLRSYTAPIHTSLGSVMDGTSYTTLPEEITASYTGTLTKEDNQNIIRGTLTFTFKEQSERLSVNETDYAYQSGEVNQKIVYCKGQFEYYVTNMEIDGTFVMVQKPKLLAVIVDPYNFLNPNQQFIVNVANYLRDSGFKVQYISDDQCTVKWLETGLNAADLILWRGHIVQWRESACIMTGQTVDWQSNGKDPIVPSDLQGDYKAGFLVEGQDPITEKWYWAVNWEFIQSYYQSSLSKSLVYVEGCHSLEDGKFLADTFIGSDTGSGTYIGFTGRVNPTSWFVSGDGITENVFRSLAVTKSTVSEAVNDAKQAGIISGLSSIAYYGNPNLKLSQLGRNPADDQANTIVYGATASSSTSTYSNFAVADHLSLTGVSTSISGSSLNDGTRFTVSTVNFGTDQPEGTSNALNTNGRFYDVKINPDSSVTLGEDVVAQISFSDPSFTSNSVISYWNGTQWVALTTSFEEPNTVDCSIPVSSLTGTVFAVQYTEQVAGTSPSSQPAIQGNPNPPTNQMQIVDALGEGISSIFGSANNLAADQIQRITGTPNGQVAMVALATVVTAPIVTALIIVFERRNRSRRAIQSVKVTK